MGGSNLTIRTRGRSVSRGEIDGGLIFYDSCAVVSTFLLCDMATKIDNLANKATTVMGTSLARDGKTCHLPIVR